MKYEYGSSSKPFRNGLNRKSMQDFIKPKILFIMHMPPPVHGAAMVGKYIHDSKVINDTFYCHYINLATAADINDIGKWRIGKILNIFRLLIDIIRLVHSVKPDLVYMTPNAKGIAFFKEFIIVQFLKTLRCRVVIHYHNKGVVKKQDKTLYNLLYTRFFKQLKVILLANNLYSDIKKYVDRKNIYICPNGIPEYKLITKKKHTKFNILFLSNMMKEKGVFTLLDACKILMDRHIDFHCHFVGKWSDITEADFNRYLLEHQLAEKVTAYGAKYGDDKNEFFAVADLFVFPTYYNNECFPLVLLEAMQQNIACIASDEGGICNIIDNGKTGYIVPKKDAKILADKIEYLYNHPEVNEQMSENGYNKYKERFTLSVFEYNFTEILLEIVNNNKVIIND